MNYFICFYILTFASPAHVNVRSFGVVLTGEFHRVHHSLGCAPKQQFIAVVLCSFLVSCVIRN